MSPPDPAPAPTPAGDLPALIAAESARHRRRRLFIALGVVGLALAVAALVLALRPRPPALEARFRSAPLTRGPVIRQISPTGRLEARVTVDVGAQITGRIAEYNAVVHRGQILARLDPASLSAQVDQSAAGRRAARAALKQAPILTQNVVTYEAVLEVDNPELKLKPGMTASVKIDTAEVQDALRAPNAALRFTPPGEVGGDASVTPASAGPALWTLAGELPRRRPVQVGISDDRVAMVMIAAAADDRIDEASRSRR